MQVSLMQSHLELDYLPLLANPANYPKPALSFLPSAKLADWPVPPSETPPNGAEALHSAFLHEGERYRLGRYALAEALRRAGAGPGRAVWMPAYHCRTMPEAAQHVGAPVYFYPLKPDLTPDFQALEPWLSRQAQRAPGEPLGPGQDAVAWLQVHFFGFPRAFDEAKALCQHLGLALVEDCSHAFYGHLHGKPLGSLGDYAAASAWKFLPVPEAAVLRDNRADAPAASPSAQLLQEDEATVQAAPRRRVGLKAEIKSAKHWLGQWRSVRPAAVPVPDLQGLMPKALELLRQQDQLPGGQASGFKAEHAQHISSRLQWAQVQAAPHRQVAQARRQVYLAWLQALEGAVGVRPLFATLPEGVAPYAIALEGDAQGLMFHLLKLCAVPVWRWEDMAQQALARCPVTAAYRKAVLQLPCHQSLEPEQLQWMANCVRQCALACA